MAKIIPIDVIKGISGKYGNKSSDYFATNRSSNQIHLAKIVNPYQGPPTEKQKAQQAKFAARQVVSTAWLNANRPSETTGEKGTADYQLVQRMKRQMGLSNINQLLHKYMGEDNIIRLPHGDEFQAPPTQDGGGSSAGGTKRRHTITLTSANPDQGTVSGGGTYDEGAQATMLDIDHGTYPFVTSSNCTAGGAVTGSGVGPCNIERVLGVAKAYLTRVGSGPFPTELDFNEGVGKFLLETGHEYGVTTGRKRRCGWYDAVVVKYAAQINGLTDLAITKLDVLTGLDTIKVCTAYECDGVEYDTVPEHRAVFDHAKPKYIEVPGWQEDITGCKSFDELPQAAQDYIKLIEDLSGVKVSIVAVGPDREQTINRFWK